MSYYILPPININLEPKHFKLSCTKEYNYKISPSVSNYSSMVKYLIEDHSDQWDFIKKYTNQYEFIHTTIPNKNTSICKIKPISRAFFKLIEIYNQFNLLPKKTSSLKSFHLAEGPGGFIEATIVLKGYFNHGRFNLLLEIKRSIL